METRSVTDCNGANIVVTLTNDISDAITTWAEVAEQYEIKTEITLDILGQYFLTRNQFLSYDQEIKYYISKGLSLKDQLTLSESAVFLNERRKNPEKTKLTEARTLVKKKILKIFNRLLQELFPSFLPPPLETPPKLAVEKPQKQATKEKTNEDDDTIPYPSNELTDDETTTPTMDRYDEDPLDEDLLSNLDMSNLSLNEPRVNLNPHFNRARYGNATASLPQGFF